MTSDWFWVAMIFLITCLTLMMLARILGDLASERRRHELEMAKLRTRAIQAEADRLNVAIPASPDLKKKP